MIDFQSSVAVESSSHRPCYSPPGAPAPGGAARGEGELSPRGPQSALIDVGTLPSGTLSFPSIKSIGFPLCLPPNLADQKQAGWTGKLNKKFMQTSFTLNLPAMPKRAFRVYVPHCLLEPICAQLHLLSPFFRKKKIV
jgi:hypothetical protein